MKSKAYRAVEVNCVELSAVLNTRGVAEVNKLSTNFRDAYPFRETEFG